MAFRQTNNSPEGVDSNDDKYLLWLLAPINFDKTAILENAALPSDSARPTWRAPQGENRQPLIFEIPQRDSRVTLGSPHKNLIAWLTQLKIFVKQRPQKSK